jgi:RNA polymerase sigma-70 factor, ECF subfamily
MPAAIINTAGCREMHNLFRASATFREGDKIVFPFFLHIFFIIIKPVSNGAVGYWTVKIYAFFSKHLYYGRKAVPLRDERHKTDETEVAGWLGRVVAESDPQSWGRIFEKYKRPIFMLCHRMLRNDEDAKDVTSDAFMKAFENIRTYDMNRPFYPWLYRIATNLCIDFIHRNGKFRFMDNGDWEMLKIKEDPVDEEKNLRLQIQVKKAIDKLKRPQRICFCLFYLHGKSYNDIARITRFSYDEVRSHIQNGRRKFKLAVETKALSRG